MKFFRRSLSALLGSALLISVAACGSSSQNSSQSGSTTKTTSSVPASSGSTQKSTSAKGPIHIAWLGGLTGFLAEFALDARHGTEMAVAKVNAQGGILGRKVVVDYQDTGTNPQKARQAAQRVILSGHAVGIIGDFFSPNTLALLPIVDKYEVPTISYESTAYKVTHSGSKYMFRTVVGARPNAMAMALYAIHSMHDTRFVMLGGTDAYAQANMKNFKAAVDKLGGTIMGTENYNPSSTKEFTPFFQKYQGKKVQAFFLGGSPPQNALIIKQARANGFKQAMISTTGIDRSIIWKGDGPAAVGATMVLDTPGMAANGSKYMTGQEKTWEQAFFQEYHQRLASYDAGHAYDATMLLLRAIQKAGSTTGPAVRQAILSLGASYKGVASDFTLTPNGDAQSQLYVMRWGADGKLHIIATIPDKQVYGTQAQ